jgi:hypothetical protein
MDVAMKSRRCVWTGVLLIVSTVYIQSTSAAIWDDPAAIPEWSGRSSFGGILTASSSAASGTLHGFVDYAVYAPGDYTGSVSFNNDLYVYAYQVSNDSDSTVGIDYFSVGLLPDVSVPDVTFDPSMGYAIPGGINPALTYKLPESAIYLYSADNIGAGEWSTTFLFTSIYGPGSSNGYVSGGTVGGENVVLPAPVPEPATISLITAGALMALARRRKS